MSLQFTFSKAWMKSDLCRSTLDDITKAANLNMIRQKQQVLLVGVAARAARGPDPSSPSSPLTSKKLNLLDN